jgi:2-aminobenzoate-CoA ligase
MRKYASLDDRSLAPTLIFALPELVYPQRLNAARTCLEAARLRGGSAAYLHGDARLPLPEVEGEVGRYAAALRRLGVAASDRVLLRLADTPALVCAILAVQAIGAVAVPTYVQLRADDLLYRVRDAGAKVALVGADLLAEMRPCAAEAGDALRIAALPEDPERAFESFQALLPPDPVRPDYADTDADDVALILYTSGSTGKAKGTLHAQRDILAVCDTYARYCVQPGPDDVIGGPAALPFALGVAFFVYYPLFCGCSAVLEPDKAPATAMRLMETHGVSILVGVASYYTRLLALVRERGGPPARLRMSLTGGEPLLAEVERGWRAATGLALAQFLGTTEMLGCFLGSRHGRDSVPEGAIGLAVPGFECSVRDPESFAPLPAGAPGLLCMRGPTGTLYWNKPEEQRKVVRDGWNVFQDVVVRDEAGFVRYVSRSDEMIVTAGYNVAPVDVETVLIRHPAVAECACVPAPDPGGARAHVIKAYVVAKDGVVADAVLKRALQDHVKANAPPYMYPREIAFAPALPKTPSGKVRRGELRRLAAEARD